MLKHFRYHPFIPLRTLQLTLTSLRDDAEAMALSTRLLPLQSPLGGASEDILRLRVVITAEQRTIGFIQIGSMVDYHSVVPPLPLETMRELLKALLSFVFFIGNKTAIQLLSQPADRLAEACTALDLPRRCLQPPLTPGFMVQRADFYQQQCATTPPLTLAVVALLLRADGAILLSQPAAPQRAIPSWELPGGKVSAGETPELALVRELQEELGITVSAANLLPLLFATERGSPRSLLVHFYLSTVWSAAPAAQEQQTLAWVLPAQIHHYPMQITHQIAFYQLAYLLGRYSLQWADYARYLQWRSPEEQWFKPLS